MEGMAEEDRRQASHPTMGIAQAAQLLLPPQLLPPQRLLSQVNQARVRALLLSNQLLTQPSQSHRLLRPVVEAVVEGLVLVRAWKSNGQATL